MASRRSTIEGAKKRSTIGAKDPGSRNPNDPKRFDWENATFEDAHEIFCSWADHVQGVMLRYKREFGVVPLLQVHDELVFERDRSLTDDENRKFISVMCEPTWRLDGFSAPCEAKIGDNWKDMRVFFGE